MKLWTTLRGGRNDYFRGIDHRIEFEIGLGKRLQTAFYLNYGYSRGIETQNEIQSENTSTSYSFSNEWKFKLTDPVANALGSALYFEYGIGPDESELEGKIILDKQVGRTLHAFNIVGEYEFEKEFVSENDIMEAETEREAYFELDYAFPSASRRDWPSDWKPEIKTSFQHHLNSKALSCHLDPAYPISRTAFG